VRRASQAHGGHGEPLADGSTIVVIEAARRVATDLAAQAARCALALRAAGGRRRIALAMGRADTASTLPSGDAIDRAARLLAPAAGEPPPEPPPIAIDEVIAGLLDARFDVAETETGLWLHGERPLSQGARTLLGRATACVGRDWELTALAAILDECIEDVEAQAVVVTAAAGMGKSRLAAEFVTRVQQRARPVAIWMGRGDSLRAGSTLDLLAQALRGALGILDGAPLEECRDRIRARVAERLPTAEQQRVAEFLGELVGAPFPDGELGSPQLAAARKDAHLMSEQMSRAWLDFLAAEAAAQPVLLVLEDLHWGDFATVRFIDTALRDRGQRSWMVLALARPEVHEVFPGLWADRKHVQEIRLKQLGRRAGERLVRQVLGDRIGADTIEHLVKLADGNAFYLEELIRAVAEGKGQSGALPETVLAMVESRLARLAFDARRVLRAASVFGEVSWEAGIVAVLGESLDPASVAEWLARLVEQEILGGRSPSRFLGQRELAFRHALLREGAYATLTEEDLRLEHGRAGEWLEQHGEADPMVLAAHFERGCQRARAASAYLRGAEQAYLVRDLAAVMARAGLGLACEPPEEVRIRLLGARCDAASSAVQMIGDVMPAAEELLRAALPGSLPWAQAMVAYLTGMLVAGRVGDFMAAVEQLRTVEPGTDATGKLAVAFIVGIMMLDNLGHVPAATALADRFTALVTRAGDRDSFARFWWHYAMGMRGGVLEDPWRISEHADALEARFAAIGGRIYALSWQLVRGLALWSLGASSAAERMLEGIAAADESMGVSSSLRRFALSWMYADRGALDAARTLASELSERGLAHHNTLEESRGRWALGEVLRRTGDLDDADRELAAALASAVALEQPGILASLAALRLAQGRAAEALVTAEDATARAASMAGCGMFRSAFLRLVRAEALHATGALDAARAAIAAAHTRLHSVADTIPDPAYRASFLEGVPEHARTLALARAWLAEPAPGA
jgi:eukaryotic-like serine/threonine-protein kinase